MENTYYLRTMNSLGILQQNKLIFYFTFQKLFKVPLKHRKECSLFLFKIYLFI